MCFADTQTAVKVEKLCSKIELVKPLELQKGYFFLVRPLQPPLAGPIKKRTFIFFRHPLDYVSSSNIL